MVRSTFSVDSAGKENALGATNSLYLQPGDDIRREILVVWYEPVRGRTGILASHKASYAVVKLQQGKETLNLLACYSRGFLQPS